MNRHYHPEIYHKHFNQRKYFEGWYYKQVSANGQHTISLIPGVSFDQSGSHSFIQCLHYNEKTGLNAYNIDFPMHAFQTTNSPFEVKIEQNSFNLKNLTLSIKDTHLTLEGSIDFQGITPIKQSLFCPNIMGIFSYVPHMECNHGILSMNHSLNGSLRINGDLIDFTGGKGFIEKDWGRSFPEKYIWLQSNHFDNSTVSIFCSIAKIPYGLFSFTGFICNLIHENIEYRFATYMGSKLTINEITDQSFDILLRNKKHTLHLKGSTQLSKELLAPKHGSMNTTIKEGLSGKILITLKNKVGECLYTSSSNQSGIELEYL